MADAFAPQIQGEVRFNQPVEMPAQQSGLGAVADLVGMFSRSFSSAQEARASTAPKTNKDLVTFREGLELVEDIRQRQGETAALIAERKLASNFAMAGINLDDDYKDVYEKTTGRTWAGYGADNEARIMEETLKDPQVQASYVASFAVNKDWTEEQRIEYAIGQKATLQAAENEIARSKAEAGYKWSVQSEAAYSTSVDTFVNINLGGLQTLVQQGGRVTPQDIANLSAQWGQYKVRLSRPSGVSDDQWKAVQDKISNVDKMLETFQKATSSEVLLETLTTGIAQDMLKQGGGSVESRLAGVISIKDPASLNGLVGGVSEFIMGASGSLNFDIPIPNLFGHVVETQGGLASETDPNAVLTVVPDDIKKKLEGKTPEQIYKGLEAAGLLTSVIGPADLSRPEARQQFVENATTIGAVLMNNPSDQFLSDAALKKLIANPQFIRNINALEATDPEAYTVARQFVRGGLSTELARQQRNLAAIESQMAITWDGSKYTFDRAALIDKGYSSKRVDEFIAWFNSPVGYSGDIQALANFNKPIPEGMLVISPVDINQAIDRRNSISTINKAMTALNVEVETPEGQEAATGGSSSPVVSVVDAGKGFTVVRRQDGTVERIEGTRAWRNNNPGNIEYGDFAKGAGAVGTDGRFAVFPTYEAGRAAKKKLLWETRGYAGKTIAEAINRYAPPVENDTNAYVNSVASAIGVPIDTPMSSLSEAQKEAMLDAMEIVEGFRAGKITAAQAGSTETTPARPTDANAVAAAAGGAAQRAIEANPVITPVSMRPPAEDAPSAPVTSMAPPAEAALPEQIEQPQPSQAAQEEAARTAPPVDREVAALIDEIAGNPDKTYASERELLAAQQRGELEPGDTIIVDGVAYMVRKDGTPKRLGVVQE